MSEREQNPGQPSRALRCEQWESWLVDALDGTLSAPDQAAFDRHQSECAQCRQMYKETRQGKAWMDYLAVEPPAPDDLLGKILARTSQRPGFEAAAGAAAGLAAPREPAHPGWRTVAPMVRQALEPRLLMTAAMAFFSLTLTLNLVGIKLTQIRPADLRPARMRANLTRQYYSTNEQVMKYYENLRLVYEVEARVRELRRTTETEPAPTPRETPKPAPRDGSGGPRSTVPNHPPVPNHPAVPGGWLAGDEGPAAVLIRASLRPGPRRMQRRALGREGVVCRAEGSNPEQQAERSRA